MKSNKELLAPAGDKERALFALTYGADAVYFGGKQFSLRARASNFEFQDIEEVVKFAHANNKKVYLVANILCHNFHLPEFKKFFDKVTAIGVDAFIVADPFIFKNLRDKYNVECHISTQQSITNSKSAAFWKRNGATRVVLAREMKFDELKLLTEHNNNEVEIEAFIHGAVCISYSGRCMMSNNFSLRDANVGGCAQSCRWEYTIKDNNCNHLFTMSAKDMVYLQQIQSLDKLNLHSYKIEGRMKTVNYLTTVVKTYRTLLDHIDESVNINNLQKQIDEVANRPTDTAFLYDANADKMLYHDEARPLKQDFIFSIIKKISNTKYQIQSKNYFDMNTNIKIIKPIGNDEKVKIKQITTLDGEDLSIVRTPMTDCIITLEKPIEMNEFCLGKVDYE